MAGLDSLLLALVCVLGPVLASRTGAEAAPPNANSKEYWIQRRAKFYQETIFELSERHSRLLGREPNMFNGKLYGHLPFWFDYELFKQVFKRPVVPPEEEEQRHRAYLDSCLRAIKERTLFRMLAGVKDTLIGADADKFFWEKQPQLAGLDSAPEMSVERSVLPDNLLLERAVRLMRAEMERVESKNQLETYLRAFEETDGSAIDGKLPY